MPHEVATFGRREELQRRGDQRTDVVKRARAGRAEERFQFGEGEFDRIEVGAVGWEKPELGATASMAARTSGCLWTARLSRTTTSPGWNVGDQDLLDVGEERWIVDRAVEHGRGPEAVKPERGDDGVRLPMATGRVIAKAGARGTAPVAAQQIGRDAAFIEEHILAHVAQRLPRPPLPARRGDIRPTLFVGVYRFF